MTDRDEIERSLRDVLAVLLKRPLAAGIPVRRETEAAWDSLKHVEILFAVEEALQVRFDEDELAKLDSLEAFVAAVERHHAS